MNEMDLDQQMKLTEIFDDGLTLYEDIVNSDKPTNSGDIQVKIRRSMKLFEEATKLVSVTSVFSQNESIEEVATNDLKYFLLPSLLGNLTQKLSVAVRSEVIETADIYFRDFLQRCKDYGITDIDIPMPIQDENDASLQLPKVSTPAQRLMDSSRNRATKIQQYNEQKALQSRLKEMKSNLNTQVDDEHKRNYYVTLIKSHVYEALGEIESLKSEREILKYMEKMKPVGGINTQETQERLSKGPKHKPLKPIIITRDEVQKKVFGAGYPSLPTMTVKEFYDQRVKDGVFPDTETIKARSLQDMANQQNAEAMADKEAEENERRAEEDDEESLARARQRDEYRDTHQRGWGNRYNRS